MNGRALFLAAVASATALFVVDARAQRTFVERPGADVGVRYAGDWRAANSLRNLNDELRQAEFAIDARGAARGIRQRFANVARATDRLNYEYNRRLSRPFSIHQHAEALRVEVRAIRRAVRGRSPFWR